MMIIYDSSAIAPYNAPWARSYFDGCFGGRKSPAGLSVWVVPGTWPEWAL